VYSDRWQTEPPTGYVTTPRATGGTDGHVTYYVGGSGSAPDTPFGPDLRKARAKAALVAAWNARRKDEAWRALRSVEAPRDTPPKARTEWGMVHRERCVHRMGQN
jgi:hypothetical protein